MFIVISLLLISALLLTQKFHDSRLMIGPLPLSPVLVMNCGWILYGVTPLLFVKDLIIPVDAYEISYMLSVSTAIIFWCFGVWFGSKLAMRRVHCQPFVLKQSQFYISKTHSLVIVVVVYILVIYWVSKVFGGGLQYLTQQYGIYNQAGISSVTSSIPFVVAGLIFVVVLSSDSSFLKFALMIIPILFLLGGNRNIAIFILIGVVFCQRHGHPQSAKFLVTILVGAVFAAAMLAVAREYGILNIMVGSNANFELSEAVSFAKRYNDGEFGTMFRLARYTSEAGGFVYFFPGFSYIFSPIVNMVPTALFSGRPDTIATVFSYAYADAARGEVIEGLGFSPLAEARINFGILMGIPIFVWGVFIAFLSRFSVGDSRDKAIVKFLVIAVVAASLNYFRIDFALYTKFILICFAVSSATYKICRLRFRVI